VKDWKHALDHNKGVLSSDMSKAFDSMYPPLLLSKLQANGMSNSSLAILESYFKDRKNRIRLSNNVSSDWKTVTRGCPQGSSLGPVLWNIYQNDLFYENISSQFSMYADDYQLYSLNQTIAEASMVLEMDGRITGEWYKINHLEAKLSKYHVMMMTKRNGNITDVDIDNNTIRQTEQMKLLGVTFG
jgi:hypothetical protein